MREQYFILGSASPRRSEILGKIGVKFESIPSQKEERITKKNPKDIVQELSLQKALDVNEQVELLYKSKDVLILCADTMVAKKKHIFGKPIDEEDAKKMLMQLQGGRHKVYTGVTVLLIKNGVKKIHTFYVSTKVYMNKMDVKEVERYIDTGECLDKAGSYAIQGYGAKYIRKIIGDYFNVCGLPIATIYSKYKEELNEYIKNS